MKTGARGAQFPVREVLQCRSSLSTIRLGSSHRTVPSARFLLAHSLAKRHQTANCKLQTANCINIRHSMEGEYYAWEFEKGDRPC